MPVWSSNRLAMTDWVLSSSREAYGRPIAVIIIGDKTVKKNNDTVFDSWAVSLLYFCLTYSLFFVWREGEGRHAVRSVCSGPRQKTVGERECELVGFRSNGFITN